MGLGLQGTEHDGETFGIRGSTIQHTNIEWAKNPDGSPGYTWNPITGCLKGCAYCYARKLANGRLKHVYLAKDALADPFYPRFWPEKLGQNLGNRPAGIFVCSMGELFGPWLPREWTEQVMEAISEAPQHRFYLLTKQPQELVKWSPFPSNCFVGISVTNLMMARAACMAMAQIEATVKYISFEPLLESVPCSHLVGLVDWVIIGAQTRPNLPPKVGWVRSVIEAADAAGIPVFLKNDLGWPRMTVDGSAPFYRRDGGTWVLRQEMPDAG